MNTCNIFILFFGLWCAAITIWCLRLDSKNDQLEKWRDGVKKEVSHLQRFEPDIWAKVEAALCRYTGPRTGL